MTRFNHKSVAEKATTASLKLLAKQIVSYAMDNPNDLTGLHGQLKVQRNILTDLICGCQYPDSEISIIKCRQQAYDTFNRLTSGKFLSLNPDMKTDTHLTPSTMYNINYAKILSTVYFDISDKTLKSLAEVKKRIVKKLVCVTKPKQKTLNAYVQQKLMCD